MKIAVATDDGQTISRHFGRALYYVVVTLEEGRVIAREQREKAHHGPGEHHHAHGQGEPALHTSMSSAIADCQVLIAGGMGYPAFESLRQAGIEPVITDVRDIDQAVADYAAGRLDNHQEWLH